MSIFGLHKANIPEHVQLPPKLVTGIAAIDDEHRLLIAQFDYLRKERDQTLDSETMGECAYVIGQTLLDHFKNEEELMKRSNMPADEIDRHIKEHSRIINEYVALQEKIMANPKSKVRDVLHHVEQWTVAHIAEYDLAIRRYA